MKKNDTYTRRPERVLTESQEAVSGILYRYFGMNPDGQNALVECGIVRINAAVDEVVETVGELSEIGSSDSWVYIRRCLRILGREIN
jgi:hypothetical protein